MAGFGFQLADPNFYLPAEQAEDDQDGWSPSGMPADWVRAASGLWTTWRPPAAPAAAEAAAWKVHVGTTRDRAQHTLDRVAAVCRRHRVAFKHLTGDLAFLLMHHKHGPRIQSGKFCAIYPGTVEQARSLMDDLSDQLHDCSGPYVLTDRRFRDSRVVSYRYGSAVGRHRVELDGTRTPLLLDQRGRWVPDLRRPEFILPEGVDDPFLDGQADAAAGDDEDELLDGRFLVTAVIQHSNAGGVYRAQDARTGRTVLLKEARGHNGLFIDGSDAKQRLRHEWTMMRRIHSVAPGLCPEPYALFTAWENDFLAMELVPGVPLISWYANRGTLHRLAVEPLEVAEYHAAIGTILDGVQAALDRLHALGIGFGDLSHGNVLVDPDSLAVRLIDFESSGDLDAPAERPGTEWFRAPDGLPNTLRHQDEHAIAACAQLLLFPLFSPLERGVPGRLELLRRDLEACAPLPEDLWRLATRPQHHPDNPARDVPIALPSAAELDAAPVETLRPVVQQLCSGLLAMGRLDQTDWMFPVHPDAYARNTLCRAHGAAGVLDVLRQTGTDPVLLDPYLDRLAADASAADLAPGLRTGLAGIAWTLAAAGWADAAAELIGRAHVHPLTLAATKLLADRDLSVPDRFGGCPGLGNGLAGIGMAQLGLHREDIRFDLGPAVAIGDLLLGQVERFDAPQRTPGLDDGFSGIAMFLLALADATDDPSYRQAALDYCRAEIGHGVDDGTTLSFTDRGGARTITYLTLGAAGVACALTRAVATTADPVLRDALPRVLAGLRMHSSVQPSLDTGVGSWVWAFADHAEYAGGPDDQRTAVRIATSLVKYLVPVPEGLASIGVLEPRLHTGLSTGLAGVLLTLARVTGLRRAQAWAVTR